MRLPWLALTLAITAATACGSQDAPSPTRLEPMAVRIATVERRDVSLPHEVVGTVRAEDTVVVSSRVLGHVDTVHVAAGDVVRAGELLIELDSRELEAVARQAEAARAEVDEAIREAGRGLDLARADLDLATATHRRYAELFEKRSVSAQEHDEVTARRQRARATVEMAEARRRQADARRDGVEAQLVAARVAAGHARITAPMSGTITVKHLDAGSLATPGAPLLTMERAGQFELVVAAPASLLGRVSEGLPISVLVDGLGEDGRSAEVAGRVSEVIRAVDPRSRTFSITIALPPDDRLRSGAFGRARLPAPRRSTVTVALGAVIQRGQVQSVLVVDGGVARRRLVSLGDVTEDRAEVLSGLAAGERVVLDPTGVADGQPVTVRRAS